MSKTLYFEGAGWVSRGELPNCRIRTAFTNKDGAKIYLELISNEKSKNDVNNRRYVDFSLGDAIGFCDSCFYITDDPNVNDENYSRLSCESSAYFPYTYDGILKFVNENCNADFDNIVVLDDLAGYRVHANSGKHNTSERYNFGDTFVYDEELTRKRIEKVAELKKHFTKIFNQKYDNTSYYIENNALTVCINVDESKRIAAGYNDRKFIVEV